MNRKDDKVHNGIDFLQRAIQGEHDLFSSKCGTSHLYSDFSFLSATAVVAAAAAEKQELANDDFSRFFLSFFLSFFLLSSFFRSLFLPLERQKRLSLKVWNKIQRGRRAREKKSCRRKKNESEKREKTRDMTVYNQRMTRHILSSILLPSVLLYIKHCEDIYCLISFFQKIDISRERIFKTHTSHASLSNEHPYY